MLQRILFASALAVAAPFCPAIVGDGVLVMAQSNDIVLQKKLREARECYDNGNYAAALERAEAALKRSPRNSEALYIKTQCVELLAEQRRIEQEQRTEQQKITLKENPVSSSTQQDITLRVLTTSPSAAALQPTHEQNVDIKEPGTATQSHKSQLTFQQDNALTEQKDAALKIIAGFAKKGDPQYVGEAQQIIVEIYKQLKHIMDEAAKKPVAAQGPVVDPLAEQKKAEQQKIDSLSYEINKQIQTLADRRVELAVYRNNPNQLKKYVEDTNESIRACENVLLAMVNFCIYTPVYDPSHIRCAKAACDMLTGKVSPIKATTIEMCPQWYEELQKIQKSIMNERQKSPATFAAKAAEFEAQVDNSAYVVAVKQQKAKKVKSLHTLVAEIKKSLR